METNSYKLGEYKIIEHSSGDLRWETHFGLGGLKEGRCFKKGTILFIGPAENDRPGFLKLEFIEHLKRLPDWSKTKYYCSDPKIYHCKTDRKVTKEEMQLWTIQKNLDGKDKRKSHQQNRVADFSIMTETEDLVFQLNRYEIILKKDGQIFWRLFRSPVNIRSGTGIILEDILILKPSHNRSIAKIEQQSQAKLQHYPKWNQTKYYCLKFPLQECRALGPLRKEKEILSNVMDAPKLNDIGINSQYNTKAKIFRTKQEEFSFEKILAGIKTSFKSTTVQSEKKHFSRLDFKRPDSSNSIEIFQSPNLKKWFIGAIILLSLTIMFFLVFLVDHSKKYLKKWHFQEQSHHTVHRRGH